MTGKEFEALPYVPKEIQVKCNDYLHQIASYKETDFTENGYRLVVDKGVVGILVLIKSEHSLRFCPMNKIL